LSDPIGQRRPVTHASAWTAAELQTDSSWVYELSTADIRELEQGLATAKRSGEPAFRLRRAQFPLPRFHERMGATWDQLEHGRGIALLRGLPVQRYALEDIELLYWGIGLYLGIAIPQNSKGDYIGHVRDIGLKWGEVKDGEVVRGYLTRTHLPFHSDAADLVALLCVQKAKSGGVSSVASSMAIYNAILASEPDALEVLFRGFHYSLRGEGGGGVGQVSSHRVPLFSWFDGKLSARYVRKTIETAAELGGVPLTDEELWALDLVDAHAKSDALRFDMDFEPGDIQILNNFVAFHSRTHYEDHDDPALKRHLLRMWLQVPQGRELAPALRSPYGDKSPFLTREKAMRIEGITAAA
jgi:hypothetical protein